MAKLCLTNWPLGCPIKIDIIKYSFIYLFFYVIGLNNSAVYVDRLVFLYVCFYESVLNLFLNPVSTCRTFKNEIRKL